MGYKNWMLVEGRNDQYVLRGLLRHHGIPCAIPDRDRGYGEEAIIIDQKEGVQGVLAALNVVLDDGDLERLAVVVDADTSIDARWDALRNILARFGGQDIPRSPLPEGTIVTLTQPYRTLRVGVWLMPDNQVPGILENFQISHSKRRGFSLATCHRLCEWNPGGATALFQGGPTKSTSPHLVSLAEKSRPAFGHRHHSQVPRRQRTLCLESD